MSRRRGSRVGSVVAIVAGIAVTAAVLAACAVVPSQTSARPTGPARVASLPRHAHRTAVDVGRVRLWLPAGWRLVSDDCVPGSKMLCFPRCPPGAADTVTVAPFAQVLRDCHVKDGGVASVWIALGHLGPGPATRRLDGLGQGSVVVSVPALGVTLYGFAHGGARVAEAFGASTLDRVLHARLDAAVPHGWRRVGDGALSVAVPPTWPVRHLNGSDDVDPGACGGGDFPTPVADVGFSDVVPQCSNLTSDTSLRGLARPANGVWLQEAGVWLDPAGTVARRAHGLVIDLRPSSWLQGSNALQVVVHRPGLLGDLVLGLGPTPKVALEILSSMRLNAEP